MIYKIMKYNMAAKSEGNLFLILQHIRSSKIRIPR
jgi:hypothetical protein